MADQNLWEEVTGHIGKVHDYLGMIFDYTHDGKVMINQIEYIKLIIDEFPEEIKRTRAVGNTKETSCCSGTLYFLLNRKYVHASVYRLSCDH